MKKTGQQIENDIYELVKEGSLNNIIGGKVYKYGTRPIDSKSEDAVVKFVTGLETQIASGIVVINVFIPDLRVASGVYMKNCARCEAIEVAANKWIDDVRVLPEYQLSLVQTIYAEHDSDIHEHFITIRLKYKYIKL